MNCHEAGRLLDAYLDGELSPADAAAVAGHVEGCAACSGRLAALQSLGRLVRSVPYHPAPDRLRAAIIRTPRSARVKPATLALAATVTLAVMLGGTAAFRASQHARATSAFAQEAIDQHTRALMSGHVIDVRSSSQHTVKPWFQGKLDFSPPVVDLEAAGFPLVGGRVDALAGRPAAALVYQRREHIINVFVLTGVDRTAAADARTIRGFQERHWTHADLSVWAVSDLNDRELAEFAAAFESATR